MTPLGTIGRRLLLFLALLACVPAPLSAGEKIEIKYLAPDAATAARIKSSLALQQDSADDVMEIYFFDTPTLTLLKERNLILRLRHKGKTWTFTIKERPSSRQPAASLTNFEIETDESISTREKVRSYSIDSSPSPAAIKAALTQHSITGLLSLDQQRFLSQLPQPLPTDQIRCFPKIEARRWTLPDAKAIDAESWQYPGGELLELSYKSKANDPVTAEKNFSTWLTTHSLNPQDSGLFKTATALEALSKQLPLN